MSLQTKNLKLLTEHNDIMSGVMMDEKHAGRVQGYRRENKAFQNQQIQRIERDLERTSRQLQSELNQLQEYENGKLLNEALLTEIDQLFDVAEDYFNKKQAMVSYALKMSNPKRYKEISSRVNTNLASIQQEQ